MIALFAFCSIGGWGAELSGKLGTPAEKGTWNSATNTYTWTLSYSNLMDLFSGEDLTGKLGKDYAAIVFTTSGYTSGQEYRIVFMEEGNRDPLATVAFDSEGTQTVVFAENEYTKDIDLSKVKFIRFGGNTTSGSITLDPTTIKLVGHKVYFSATQQDKENVTATYYGRPFQSGNAVAPGTKLTLTATPTADKLFWTWRQKVGDNYVPSWETDKYNAGFSGATSTATIDKDLDMQADFSSIWVKAIQKNEDKEYGSVKILHNDQDKGTEYHITPWPGNIKFVAEDGPKGFFKGWYKDASYSQQADDVTKDEMIYTYIDKTYCPSIGGQDVTLYAKFEPGVQVKANVEPSFLSPTIKIHQSEHTEWVINNGQYVKNATTAVFNVEDIDGYTFKGWYQGETQKTAEKTCDYGNVYADVTLTAKFECNIANNTQKVDLTKISTPSNPSNNVTAASWDHTNKELSVKTKNTTDNVLYLKTFQNGDNRGTGIRIHAKGAKYRLIVRLNNDNNNTKKIYINDETGNYVTRHSSWKEFGLTDEQISQITDVGVAGNNPKDDEIPYTFYVKYFWIDDIADYDHTIACYGEENGQYNLGNAVYTYSHNKDDVKAAFSGISGDDRVTNTHSMKFKAEEGNKLNISSANYNFSSIGLVFDTPCNYNLTVEGKSVSGNGTAVVVPVSGSTIDIVNNDNNNNALSLAKITYNGNSTGLSEERIITVDGNERKYWLYIPGTVGGKKDVPVVFSLHGRYNNDNPNTDQGKPIFTESSQKNGFIVVYPQGRKGTDTGYEEGWNNGFTDCTGWEATGKENADTKFIQALVDELKKNNFYGSTTVDPKRFYLCGFSMGGMMTYACAKVLNGTFAAYGSCSGFPLNEFHMNLATPNPIPFIHLHGNNDQLLGIKHLNRIIENLLFRNGCKLSKKQNNDDGWTTTTENGMTRYDFKGVNGVPVTTVTFDGLGHLVDSSAPDYLWNFFSDKTVGKYDSDIEWKWDMETINANISNSSSDSYYGWKHVIDGSDRSLTYGGGGKTTCSIKDCTSAKTNCNGNHNVYNSIQLTAGKHTLYAETKVKQGWASVTLKNNLTGAEVVARKVTNNTGTEGATMNVLYEFEVGEGAEYSLILKRSDSNSACTLLEIHKGSYRPDGKKDQSQDNATTDITSGKLVELTFENVDIEPLASGNGAELTSSDGNMKLYLKSRLGIKDGKIDNKAKYIVKDPVFGHYFQNIPDADIYDRYGASDYMRVVLGTNNSLSGHDGIEGIQTTGKVTIGFWVNGDLAVNRGLAYDEPSMFYIAGNTYNGPNKEDNPHMFNITCSGGLSGYMNNGAFKYNSGRGSFGGLCDTKSNADFYKKNFYKDCNWHYITYQMYDNLSRYNMYVDGEPTCLGGYATHNAGSLDSYIAGLNSIVLGGANANNVTFAYDVAFAYDDIVIYNRVLSKREINEIIKQKKYTPSVWHFNANIGSSIFFSPEKLNGSMWTNNADGTYTLNPEFTNRASLTYDGIEEIPAFRGLSFVTNGPKKIIIDAKKGVLKLLNGVKVVFSNMVKDNYVRMEYKHQESDIWVNYNNQNMNQIVGIPSVNEEYDRAGFKITDAGDGKENSITIPSDIEISAIEATDKYFAQILFEDKNTSKEISVVTDPQSADYLPRTVLKINNVPRDLNGYSISYTSSSPHVASVDSKGNVALHGVSGSTVITAQLDNSERKYDCDIYDEYTFEPTNRIFASYEIVVSPKANASKVIDAKSYSVGETIYNEDETIGVTLGGWTYNNGTYYEKTDSYSGKEMWAGQKFEKNTDRVGYKSDSRKTEENVFAEIFPTEGKQTFSTNGSHPAKSEQLKVDDNHTYAATGNYSAPKNNESAANATPWLLPCRGSHIKIEPTDAGLISVYVMQEGCVSHAPSGGEVVDGVHYNEDEPIDVTVKKVYVADEKGEIVEQVVADTKSKVAAQMWKDDGRARAEYFWGNSDLAYNVATMTSFMQNTGDPDKWSFLDNWPNPGMQQHVFKLGNDKYGHAIITKGIVRYTFNVLPGKTYYIFSNTAKLGLAGFTFKKGKHAIYNKVKPDAKHDEWRATGEFDDVSSIAKVELKDGENYSAPTDAKNAEVKLDRTFYKNYWNAVCLPYSINRRQIEKVFGDGTMVVLMNNINTSTKKVMFIEHANQDIIAGYPYLIFPTDKADNDKTTHPVINNGIITTRATFGEANSPIFTVGTDGKTYAADNMQTNALVFKGTFSKENLPVGSYVITKSGTLANVPHTGLYINPYRAYIHFNKTDSGAKAIKLASMGFAGFDDMEGETTSIEDLLFNDGIMTRPADVFTVNGQKVRSKAENLYGLPKGVYIVNGKKYVNK